MSVPGKVALCSVVEPGRALNPKAGSLKSTEFTHANTVPSLPFACVEDLVIFRGV